MNNALQPKARFFLTRCRPNVCACAAEALVAALVAQWQKPIDTLGKAGRAFDVSWPPCLPLLAALAAVQPCAGR